MNRQTDGRTHPLTQSFCKELKRNHAPGVGIFPRSSPQLFPFHALFRFIRSSVPSPFLHSDSSSLPSLPVSETLVALISLGAFILALICLLGILLLLRRRGVWLKGTNVVGSYERQNMWHFSYMSSPVGTICDLVSRGDPGFIQRILRTDQYRAAHPLVRP